MLFFSLCIDSAPTVTRSNVCLNTLCQVLACHLPRKRRRLWSKNQRLYVSPKPPSFTREVARENLY